MKRDFLTDITIVGATLVSRCGPILHHTIPNLLKWCDWCLLMVDNESEETMEIVNKYKAKYPDRIRVEHTGFDRATEKQEQEQRGLFHRFKPLQGPIRDTVFEYMRNEVKNGKKVDILIWPDSDEIFSNSLPALLEDFWKMEDKKAITMKPIDVFGDFMTIHSRSMTGHTRIFKFFPELTAIPYRSACNYRPLTKQNRIGSNRVLIHLASLTPQKRDWRNKHWKPNARMSEALWKLPKDIREMTPDELRSILLTEPDLNVEEYLRGGDKRMPMGVNNARMALEEAITVLEKMGITTFLAFGTLLGIYRDGCIMKYDWDVDLICLGEDVEKFNARKVIDAGFHDVKSKKDIPRWKNEQDESEDKMIRTISFKKHGVRVDLDPAYLSEDGASRIILKGRKRQKFCAKHPAEWFAIGNTIDFNGKTYNIPSKVEQYLESNYGKDWSVPKYGPMPWSKRSCMSQTYECKKNI